MKPAGALILLVLAVIASAILILGYVPWSKTGTPWRPNEAATLKSAQRYWDAATIVRGRDFRSNGYARYFRRKGLAGLILIAIIASGAHLWFRRVPPGPGLAGAVLALLAAYVILDIVALPFGLAGLADARAYGISKQSVGFWLSDHYKGLAIDLVVTGIVVTVLFLLMKRFPRTWPLPATLIAAVGGIVMAVIVPLVVDPVFNKFTPLENADLKARFLDVARRGGVPAREVLVSDASRRTTALNAYFTGFGPTRRIVVYDTLVNSLKPDEAELVVAHEVGHWARGHIVKGILLGIVGTALGLVLLKLFLDAVYRHRLFDIEGVFDPAAAPLLLLLYWFATFVSLPVENAISRRMEAEADQFALTLTGDAAAQIRTEVALNRTNLGDLVPPPFIQTLLYTHPAPLERIGQAETYARAHNLALPEETKP